MSPRCVTEAILVMEIEEVLEAKIQAEMHLVEHGVAQWREKYWREDGMKIYINKAGVTKQTLACLWYGLKSFGFSFTQCDEVQRALAGQSGKYFLSASNNFPSNCPIATSINSGPKLIPIIFL